MAAPTEDEVAAAPGEAACGEDLPDMLELIEMAENVGTDVDALVRVVRQVAKRARASPDDRDLLGDFEGVAHICRAVADVHGWRGEAMIALCLAASDICRLSSVNRGSLRDGGFVSAALGLLRSGLGDKSQASVVAAASAIAAVCTASDANKGIVAKLSYDDDQGGPSKTQETGGLVLLIEAIAAFPQDVAVLTECMSALRALLTDDDSHLSDLAHCAAEIRQAATSSAAMPLFTSAMVTALGKAGEEADAQAPAAKTSKLREQALLVLRELSRRQDLVEVLAFGASLLPHAIAAATDARDPRISRAGLAVLRNFSSCEEVRDELVLSSDAARRCVASVRKQIASAPVCDQGFGLLANLTMRRSTVTTALCDSELAIVRLAHAALAAHSSRADVCRSVVLTVRNLASQDEAAAREARESDIFSQARRIVVEHEVEAKWGAAVEVARQFLREWREDEGIERKAQYNAFY